MSKIMKNYLRKMHKQYGYFATWLPNAPIALGDIGVLNNNQFNRIDSLGTKNITFNLIKSDSPGTLEYSSSKEMQITTEINASVHSMPSEANIKINLGDEEAIYFKANNTKIHKINNIDQLGKTILELYNAKNWDIKNYIVYEVLESESTTILIANNNSASIELKAEGKIAETVDLADANLKFDVLNYQGISTKYIAAGNIKPLFKLLGIKKSFKLLPPSQIGKNEIFYMTRWDKSTGLPEQDITERITYGEIGFNDLE